MTQEYNTQNPSVAQLLVNDFKSYTVASALLVAAASDLKSEKIPFLYDIFFRADRPTSYEKYQNFKLWSDDHLSTKDLVFYLRYFYTNILEKPTIKGSQTERDLTTILEQSDETIAHDLESLRGDFKLLRTLNNPLKITIYYLRIVETENQNNSKNGVIQSPLLLKQYESAIFPRQS